MVNFYHRFINNLAGCLAPLNKYLKKQGNKTLNKIDWTDEAKTAFSKSKNLLAQSALLVYPRENCKVCIVADVSDIAVGAALQQETDGIWQPIAFFSRKLDKTQKHYSAFDRELFAAYSAIRHFRRFVDGRKFSLLSDHKPLCMLFFLIQSFHEEVDK